MVAETVEDQKAPVIVVDTTAFFTDLTLSKTAWQQILSLSAREYVHLWIPEVVILEAIRHQRQQSEKNLTEMRKALRIFQRRSRAAAKPGSGEAGHRRQSP